MQNKQTNSHSQSKTSLQLWNLGHLVHKHPTTTPTRITRSSKKANWCLAGQAGRVHSYGSECVNLTKRGKSKIGAWGDGRTNIHNKKGVGLNSPASRLLMSQNYLEERVGTCGRQGKPGGKSSTGLCYKVKETRNYGTAEPVTGEFGGRGSQNYRTRVQTWLEPPTGQWLT